LTPNFETFDFAGKETVNIKVTEPTNTISVNSLEIEIHSASVTLSGEKKVATSIKLDEKTETALFTFAETIPVGEFTLEVIFTGKLNDNLAGFYRSKNVIGDQTQWLATTQFEPADARKAFPCWDEPAVKATFTIVITAPKDMTVLSNMPAANTTVEGDNQTVEFQATPIVSTYLIAVCVGYFEYVENAEKNYRVWTTPGKKEMGRFALDCGVKILDYFAEYYGIPYPLPKTDMIAIPDFAAGAMENWGLITYRETALLCDEKTSSVASKSRIAYVVAHELAHQWFGNLVTMEWWKELWLNEGFASFVGTQAVAHFFPEWEVWKQFITDYIFRAFKADALRNSHPIEVDVNEARKIDEIFDEISYSKGASVIRMISDYLGEPAFRKGLNIYLNRFKYSNAVTKDLWGALSEGSGKDVTSVMDNWVKKMGYPVVTIEETEEPGKFKVSQQRFFSSGPPTEAEDTTVWTINMAYVTSGCSDIKYVDVTQKSQVLTVPGVANANNWIKFNAGQSGLYRIRYSPVLAKRLGDALQSGALQAADRLGLVEDVFALAFSGMLPLSQALELASHYQNEDDYTVWFNLQGNLGTCVDLFDGTECEPLLNKFIVTLCSKIKRLGWEPVAGEKDLDKLLRTLVLHLLGAHGDESVIAEAKKRFAKFHEDPSSLSADLASVVFRLAVRNGDEATYQDMIKIYEKLHQSTEVSPELRVKALYSVSLVSEPALISKSLEWALSSPHVRSQDLMYSFMACCSTSHGRDVTWNAVQQSWGELKKKFSGGSFLLARIIKSMSGFATEQRAKEVEEFFATRCEPNTERALAQTLESIRTNAKTLAAQKEQTLAWLKENVK